MKKQLTEEELFEKEKRKGLEDFKFDGILNRLTTPTYTFKVGDKVNFGCLDESTVKEVLYDGKVYVLDCVATNTNYGNPYQYRTCRVCTWNEVRPLGYGDTNFTRNKDVRLYFNNSDIESLLYRYYHCGINMNPAYQRDFVWNKEDKEKLLDSVFNNIDIGKFVLIHLPVEDWG